MEGRWSAAWTRYQKLLDDTIPWLKTRWAATLLLCAVYTLRVALLGGWYIVTYALGIYLLNLLIAFLSPAVDPELDPDGAANLPSTNEDEYKPFIRRLPEFKFWYSMTRACLFAFVCTFFSFLNIPVFWPILLIYFIALFAVTMRKQIQHMIKHRYVPWVNYKKPQWAT